VLQRFQTYRNNVRGVIGAWEHGGRFNASPYGRTSRPPVPDSYGQWQEMLRFFDDYLKREATAPRYKKELYYYVMGAEEWRLTHQWPPEGITYERWYFAGGNSLTLTIPSEGSGEEKYSGPYWMVIVGNAEWTGGGRIRLSPRALMNDGKLDIAIIPFQSKFRMITKLLHKIVSGEHINDPSVSYFPGEKVEVDSTTPIDLELDGHLYGTTPATFSS